MNLINKYLGESKKKDEKYWPEMTKKEKKKVYKIAIKSGDVTDTFDGFSKVMGNSTFNVKTGEPVEV